MTYKYTQTTQPSSSLDNTANSFIQALNSPNGMLLLGCLAFVTLLYLFEGKSKKGQLAQARFGSKKEKAAAMKVAISQIEKRKHNEVALYLGRPLAHSWLDIPPLFFPEIQRGVAILGSSGTGKTISLLLQLIYSSLDQGFPNIVYDFKYPTLTKRIAGYARECGYDVRIFAPGFPESEVCNPLEFLNKPDDSLMARQFAEVLNANFKKAGQTSGDPYFSNGGDQLTEAFLMLTKSTKYADLMMAQALMSLQDFPKRLEANKNKINAWIYTSFSQLIQAATSEKTVASLISTANTNFTRFMKGDILPAFCGKTTIPLDLKGKQLLILGLDREKKDVLTPLFATILHMIVNRNVARPRKDPLLLWLDEVKTIYVPALPDWLSQNREDGLATIISTQNMVQLEERYGDKLAREILANCATKFILNPQDEDTAEKFSKYLGEQEIKVKQKSKGRSGGKASINTSDQVQTRRLYPPEKILKLPKGKCIAINPEFTDGKEGYIPIEQKIKLSPAYKQTVERSERQWSSIRSQLEKQSTQKPLSQQDLILRYQEAERLFPSLSNQTKSSSENNAKLDKAKFFDLA
ncbi:MAG: type IV secretory system conjugative DNA transfer family protein [Xenococcaceae cyanobacterium]